jgi:hypothetical protein
MKELRPHTATRENEKKVIEDFWGFPDDRGILHDIT